MSILDDWAKVAAFYSEDQPRDSHGRWGEGGSDISFEDKIKSIMGIADKGASISGPRFMYTDGSISKDLDNIHEHTTRSVAASVGKPDISKLEHFMEKTGLIRISSGSELAISIVGKTVTPDQKKAILILGDEATADGRPISVELFSKNGDHYRSFESVKDIELKLKTGPAPKVASFYSDDQERDEHGRWTSGGGETVDTPSVAAMASTTSARLSMGLGDNAKLSTISSNILQWFIDHGELDMAVNEHERFAKIHRQDAGNPGNTEKFRVASAEAARLHELAASALSAKGSKKPTVKDLAQLNERWKAADAKKRESKAAMDEAVKLWHEREAMKKELGLKRVPNSIKVQPPVNTPAPGQKTFTLNQIVVSNDDLIRPKNIKDATVALRKHYGVAFGSSKAISADVSLSTIHHTMDLLDHFHEAYDGSRIKASFREIQFTQKFNSNTPADQLWGTYSEYLSTVNLSAYKFANPEALKEAVVRASKAGFHPAGCDTIESIITHEFGHALDSFLNRDISGVSKTWMSLKAKFGTMEHPSEYATKNIKETVAESFAQMVHSPKPMWAETTRSLHSFLVDNEIMKPFEGGGKL